MVDLKTLTPELILRAYGSGVFPMAEHRNDPEVFWVDPERRGVIPLKGFHISRSLARCLNRDDFRVTLSTRFADVMDGCADREETWINSEIRSVFIELHAQGHAHSIEAWDHSGDLVGGVYGLASGGAFFGESMFSRRTNASKIALAWLVDHLRMCGFVLFDTQFLTPHLASLGAIEISRDAYHLKLADALSRRADIGRTQLPDSGQDVVQRNTQTSYLE